jgi:hypothetical protein
MDAFVAKNPTARAIYITFNDEQQPTDGSSAAGHSKGAAATQAWEVADPLLRVAIVADGPFVTEQVGARWLDPRPSFLLTLPFNTMVLKIVPRRFAMFLV